MNERIAKLLEKAARAIRSAERNLAADDPSTLIEHAREFLDVARLKLEA